MNIIYVLEDITVRGGIERILCDKANLFTEAGHNVHIISVYYSENSPLYPLNEKITLHALNVRRSADHSMRETLRILYQSFVRYNRLIGALKPDICFYVWVTGAWLLASSLHRGKKIFEQHLAYEATPYKSLLNLAVRRADTVVCLTHEDTPNFSHAKQLKVIPNFIHPISQQVQDYRVKRAIAVGRLEKIKGFDRLIHCWKQLGEEFADWHLDIYGTGPEQASLEQEIETLQLSGNIHLRGVTSNIGEALSEHSLQVVSSHFEGQPIALCEGQAAALPAVAFNFRNGASEIIENVVNGWLVKQDDEASFCIALCEAMRSAEERKKRGTKALEMSSRFSRETIAPQWIQLINE